MLSAYSEYSEAMLKKDEEAKAEAVRDMAGIVSEISNAVGNDKMKAHIVDFFRGMFPEVQAEVSRWQLEADIEAKVSLSKDNEVSVDDLISDASQFSSEKEIEGYGFSKWLEPQKTAYKELEGVAAQYKMEVIDLIRYLREMGGLNLDRGSDSYIMSNIRDRMGGNYYGLMRDRGIREGNDPALTSAINSLGQESYEAVSQFGTEQWDAIAAKAKEIQTETGQILLSGAQWKSILQAIADDYIKIKAEQQAVTQGGA